MIEYINTRMNEWARWVKRREDGGLGYPSQANFVNIIAIHGVAGPGLITSDVEPLEIETIMANIRQKRPERYEVANWFYLKGNVTSERIARELKCHRDTAYTRLHALHLEIMDRLHEKDVKART